MSTFNAINLSPQDEQVEAEEHSRELQVEEGFRIFQEALVSLNDNKFDKSDICFNELFDMDIMKPDRWGLYKYSSPTLDRLRYLGYRNRGMYYYAYLMQKNESLESDEIVNIILKVVENLTESLQHSDADPSVTDLLVQIFSSFRSQKLKRLVLEYELSNRDNHLTMLGRKKRSILPQMEYVIHQYQHLLDDLHATTELPLLKGNPMSDFQEKDLNSVLLKIQKMKTEDEMLMRNLDVHEITLNEKSWEALANSFKEFLAPVKFSSLFNKSSDPYAETEEPVEGLKFVFKNIPVSTSADDRVLKQSIDAVEEPEKAVEKVEHESSPEESRNLKRNTDDIEPPRHSQRSSKRIKEKPMDGTILDKHVDFVNRLKDLLSNLDLELPVELENLSLEAVESDSDLLFYKDLYDCLKNWSNWHSDIFNQKTSSSSSKRLKEGTEAIQLNSLLKSNVLEGKRDVLTLQSQLPLTKLESFISDINDKTPHFHEVRLLFLSFLLNQESGNRPIADYKWPSELYKTVVWLVLSIEDSLFEFIASNSTTYSYMALSIFELLVDMLSDLTEDIASKKFQGNKITDLKTQKNKLEKNIVKWQFLLENMQSENDHFFSLCFEWMQYCILQFTRETADDAMIKLLNNVVEQLEGLESPININYPNYQHIPCLNLEAVRSQLRKIKMIKKIALINGISDGVFENVDTPNNIQQISFLEDVLLASLRKEALVNNEDEELLQFISRSPLLLKIQLWSLLYECYVAVDDLKSASRVFFHILEFLTLELFSSDYEEQISQKRHFTLLNILSYLGQITSKLLSILKLHNWNIGNAMIEQNHIKLVLRVFFLFYPIFYFESLTNADGSVKSFFQRVTRSSAKIKDQISELITLLLFCINLTYKRQSQNEQKSMLIELIDCFHNFLGDFNCCGASDNHFLILSQELLCQYVDQVSYLQLKQVLWCRYHYLIVGDSYTPEQHSTKPSVMDRNNSLPLGIYLMKLLYNNTSPMLSSSGKTSLKPVMDDIIDTLGDISQTNNHIVSRNQFLFQNYLKQPLSTELFRKSFCGEVTLDLLMPNDDLQEGADAGIFFLSSIQSLNLYKARKKSMQVRPSELDSVLKTLKFDILYKTDRFESWYMLGRCFSYIVEDDLIWTADKLNVPEKKSAMALTQRKAILCYLMSVSLFYMKEGRSNDDKVIFKGVLEALGYQLIMGYHKPMDKMCFFWKRAPSVLALSIDREVVQEHPKEAITMLDFNIEQSILLSFAKARSLQVDISPKTPEGTSSWKCQYYVGKMLFKISKADHFPNAISHILEACSGVLENSASKDTIIEPHYALVNMCYKLVRDYITEVGNAMTFIIKDGLFSSQDFSSLEEKGIANVEMTKRFYLKVIELMRYLLSIDKKKWHHRPQFRIASIKFRHLDDVDGALEEMNNIVSLKSSRNLVNIWKPEFEMPGKHFVYACEYVVFYISLLVAKLDFNSIALIIKKIRRFGSGMASINEATEYATRSYIQCATQKIGIDERYIEKLLPSLNYQSFLTSSEQLEKDFISSDYAEEHIEGLKLAYQLKKSNNGITFDSVCLSIYFKYFYLPKTESNKKTENSMALSEDFNTSPNVTIQKQDSDTRASTPISASPKIGAARKRVSKKEAFDRIKTLLEKVQ